MTPGVRDLYESMEYGPAPESKEPALAWIASHGGKFDLFIDGQWTKPSSDRWFPSFNPADATELARIAEANAADVDRAVQAAKRAQPAWAALSGHERARLLYALARGVQKRSRLFATLESLDNGKPIRESRDIDIPLVARHFYYHAGWAELQDSEFPDYEPVGVVGQIIPWNFPLLMLAWKIAPALAMGNAIVLKPAEFTSMTALLFAELCEDCGLPPGVVNIVTGAGSTGQALVQHPDVHKIAFTGSTEVGRLIRTATAGSGKKLSLELGGKSPFIVFSDADLDSAVEGVVDSIWFNQGQVCCAGSRALVQEAIADAFHQKLKRRLDTMRIGDPLDKAIDVGAIIDQTQLDRISELVETGVKEGATKIQAPCPLPDCGWYYPPTLLTNVSPSSTVAQVEIFGPALVSMTFRTPTEAVALANNTVYGLAASVWSENMNLAHDVAAKLKAGAVWLNCANQFDAAAGFGGYRESGYGREGGKEGLFEYLKPKTNERKPIASVITSQATSNIDRTYKHFIGGKQARPDSGYSQVILNSGGSSIGEVGIGNRKDVRNAVEAAILAQPNWAGLTMHARAQILYYLAENLAARAEVFRDLVAHEPETSPDQEVEAAVRSLFLAAAWADKYDGAVRGAPWKGVVYTLNEPIGVIGQIAARNGDFTSFVRDLAFAIAFGNSVVAVPSEDRPIAALEFGLVCESSDVPAGVVNIVSGPQLELAKTLAEHEGVDSVWATGGQELAQLIEAASIANLKRTWHLSETRRFENDALWIKEALRNATQVKNVWTPTGE